MKPSLFSIIGLSSILLSSSASATIRYVNVNSTSPVPPYTNWVTAATVIQNAIDLAVPGDQILVTNGVYVTGGLPINGSVTNRVTITNAVTVQSVNGPLVTIIEGQQPVTGPTTRCAYIGEGGALVGFTLTNGLARNTSSEPGQEELMGGGVFCESTNAVVSRCILVGNSAVDSGGGAFGGNLNNCVITGNSAPNRGGGASACVLNNCTITANSALVGGGVDSCALQNCIAFYNTASIRDANVSQSTLNFSCTTPFPASGVGNISADPQLTDVAHLSASSPCRGAGSSSYTSATDIDGEAWLNPPSMGCDEFNIGSSGPLSVAIQTGYTNVAVGFVLNFAGKIDGHAAGNRWDFGDGTGTTNKLFPSHAWNSTGNFPVVLTASNEAFPNGIAATVTVHVVSSPTHYVARNNSTPVAPYSSWATAATNIQDAVDAADVAGALILVTNGIYDVGGHDLFGLSNRVSITKPLTLQSVLGPAGTIINGGGVASCVYLANGASLVGFTVTNGYAPVDGAGIKCESSSVNISNCVVVGNSANNGVTYSRGGGVHLGTLNNCTLMANYSLGGGGGAYGAILNNCTVAGNEAGNDGGGASECTLNNCLILTNTSFFGAGVNASTLNSCSLIGNSAIGGGGANGSTLDNCIFVSNSAAWYGGGGALGSVLRNCTITANSADSGGGAHICTLNDCLLANNSTGFEGGGAAFSTLNNCTVTNNSSFLGGGVQSSSLTNCLVIANSGSEGGGAHDSTLSHCTLTGNSTYNNSDGTQNGGGASASTLKECSIFKNYSEVGGGVSASVLVNCTVTDNSAVNGGGAISSFVTNSIVYYNHATANENYRDGEFSFSCTTPIPPRGSGNIATAPQLTDVAHIAATSPCRGAGDALFSVGVDIDDEPWLNPPSMGCDEFNSIATGALAVTATVDFTNFVQAFAATFSGTIIGHATASWWDFGDGTFMTNQPVISHAWLAPGDYAVVLHSSNDSNPGGVSATVMVHVVPQNVFYVDASGTNPIAPFASWNTAATNIQDAADAGPVGATILVTNGTYRFGGKPFYGALTNRVAVTKPQILRSVNGPAVTSIQGYQVPDTIYGESAVRCVYLGTNATMIGFTLTNGSTRIIPSDEGDSSKQQSGAGAWCEYNAFVSNCVFVGNSAHSLGGGVFGGTIYNSQLSSNRVDNYGGAAMGSTMSNCSISNNSAYSGGGTYFCAVNNCNLIGNVARNGEGGGAEGGILNNCVLSSNSAPYGGGVWAATLSNCLIESNSAVNYGGGVHSSVLTNCTLRSNWGFWGGGADSSTLQGCNIFDNSASLGGGGAVSSTLNNCILSGNSSSFGGGANSCTLNSCTLSNNIAVVFHSEGGEGGAAGFSTLNKCFVTSNSAVSDGGGIYNSIANNCVLNSNTADRGGSDSLSILNNCTIAGNSALSEGGGSDQSTVNNSIVYNNIAPLNPNHASSTLNFSCTVPLPTNGLANITNAPLFVNTVASDFRLQMNSPCINAANNAFAPEGFDLAGNLRTVGGSVDMGAYEFQGSGSVLSFAWAQQFGLPTDGSVDFLDSDGDGLNNWQEWRSGTNPTNALSVLQMLSPTRGSSGVTVQWQSVSGLSYFLQRSTNLDTQPLSVIQNDLIGETNITTYTDTNAIGSGPFFYRVGVQ